MSSSQSDYSTGVIVQKHSLADTGPKERFFIWEDQPASSLLVDYRGASVNLRIFVLLLERVSMALLYLRPLQKYWWDTTQPGPDDNGIVHLIKSDMTLPPAQDYPGHSTFCGAVKFPENLEHSLESMLSEQDSCANNPPDLFDEHELEQFPLGETPTSISFPVCDECSSIFDDIMKGHDKRGGAGEVERLTFKTRSDRSKEHKSCLFRVYYEGCSMGGVEYRVAEKLCSEQMLGEPRQIQSFEEIRLNNPAAVFGKSLCTTCADYYKSRLWESVLELPQIEVTVFTDIDNGTYDEISRDEKMARDRVEKAVESRQGSVQEAKKNGMWTSSKQRQP